MSTLQTTLPVEKRAAPGINILATAAMIALLYFGRVFFITLVIAVIIAFLLDPVVMALIKMRMPRAVSSFLVCAVAVLLLYLAGLALYTELAGLSGELPVYRDRINSLADNVSAKMDQFERNTYILMMPKKLQDATPPPVVPPPSRSRRRPAPAAANTPAAAASPAPIPEVRIHAEPKPLLSYAYGYLVSFYDVLLMASFVPFLVYFMLSWRDHLRRSFLYLFGGTDRYIAGKAWEAVAEMARAYVIGNFILGLIIGLISSIFFFIIRLPYWPIMGPLSGLLSLVPYVGLPLAAAPPLLAGLAVYDQPTTYLLIIAVVGILHLLAMNFLYPKVVGSRVHLNPLVVTVSLMFWGTLWGGIGLLLAIPMTASIKAVFDNVTSLQGYGKLLGD